MSMATSSLERMYRGAAGFADESEGEFRTAVAAVYYLENTQRGRPSKGYGRRRESDTRLTNELVSKWFSGRLPILLLHSLCASAAQFSYIAVLVLVAEQMDTCPWAPGVTNQLLL